VAGSTARPSITGKVSLTQNNGHYVRHASWHRSGWAPYSAGGELAARRPANLITLRDGHGADFVTVAGQVLMAAHNGDLHGQPRPATAGVGVLVPAGQWPGDLGLRTGVSRVDMPRAPPTSPTRGMTHVMAHY
jgi:hypothetical protein